MQAGSCRSLSCRAEIVWRPSAWTRRQTRRLSEAGAYSTEVEAVVAEDSFEEE